MKQPPDSSLSHPVDILLARLLAAWPSSRLPPASYELYRQKLADVPISTLGGAVESLIEKGGKSFPHVGEILGLCRGSREGSGEKDAPWLWAGMSFESFCALPVSARRLWDERWHAHCEARMRHAGRRVMSSFFAPESLDDALFRLGMDQRGNLIDLDPLGLGGPKHVEDHTPPDTRPWHAIHDEARARACDRMDAILARNAGGRS